MQAIIDPATVRSNIVCFQLRPPLTVQACRICRLLLTAEDGT